MLKLPATAVLAKMVRSGLQGGGGQAALRLDFLHIVRFGATLPAMPSVRKLVPICFGADQIVQHDEKTS
jgi:hypothetical protein